MSKTLTQRQRQNITYLLIKMNNMDNNIATHSDVKKRLSLHSIK